MTPVDTWLERFPAAMPPPVEALCAEAQHSLSRGDAARAKRIEALIYLLHNSVVPAACGVRATTRFAYGGIGVVLHKDTEFGEYVMIGQSVTVGGNPGRHRIDADGRRRYTPKIGNHVYIAAGARVLGGIEIGDGAIIGANAVVTRSVPPLCVVAGNPARIVRRLDPTNCLRSKALFVASKEMSNGEFVAFFTELHERLMSQVESSDDELTEVSNVPRDDG